MAYQLSGICLYSFEYKVFGYFDGIQEFGYLLSSTLQNYTESLVIDSDYIKKHSLINLHNIRNTWAISTVKGGLVC